MDQIDPSNLSLQNDIGWALLDQALVFAAKGRTDERLEKIMEAERAYIKAHPDEADAVGVAARGSLLVEKADALAASGRLREARETVQKSIDLFKGMITAHQDSPAFLAYLLEARKREVDIRLTAGDGSGADAADSEVSKLSEQYENKIQSSNHVAGKLFAAHVEHVVKADKLFKQGNYTAALNEIITAESFMREYIQLRPADFRGYDQLRNIYDWLQFMQEKLKNSGARSAALTASMQAAQIAVLLAPDDSKRKMSSRVLYARRKLSIFLYENGDVASALAMVQREVDIVEGLVQENSQNAYNVWLLGNTRCELGIFRRDLKIVGWEEAIRSGLVHILKAAEIDTKNPAYPKDLGMWRKYLAEKLEADGLKEKAEIEYRQALKYYEKAAVLGPKDSEVANEIRDLAKRGYR